MIVKRALEAPIRQIVETVKLSTAPTRGYDAATMDYVDMLQAGIIDPTKVGAGGVAECGIDRVALADDRGADHRSAGGEVQCHAADAATAKCINSATSVGAMR